MHIDSQGRNHREPANIWRCYQKPAPQLTGRAEVMGMCLSLLLGCMPYWQTSVSLIPTGELPVCSLKKIAHIYIYIYIYIYCIYRNGKGNISIYLYVWELRYEQLNTSNNLVQRILSCVFDLQTRTGGLGCFSWVLCRSPESLIFPGADVCVRKHLAGWCQSVALIASRVAMELAGCSVLMCQH